MTPQIARLYAYVHPVFWPLLWLQLRLVFRRQDWEQRDLLVAVTRWGMIHIVHTGEHWRSWKQPALSRPAWSNPVWESNLPANMVGGFLEESELLPTRGHPHTSASSCEAHPAQTRRMCGLMLDSS